MRFLLEILQFLVAGRGNLHGWHGCLDGGCVAGNNHQNCSMLAVRRPQAE
jgi:hypothetical protein